MELNLRKKPLRYLIIAVGIGILFSVLYALQASGFKGVLIITGVSLALAGASLLVGGLLGFLFGIPKTDKPVENPVETGVAAEGKIKQTYNPNTNLEQISDWLSKILIGVGLTELSAIPGALERFSGYVGPMLGKFPNSNLFASVLLIFYLVCGFLIGWLWTRIYLPQILSEQDLAIEERVNEKIKAAETKMDIVLEGVKAKNENDSKALTLVTKILNPPNESVNYPQEEINQVIKSASFYTRSEIFYRAASYRHDMMNTDKQKMERTIKIFRALIESDTDNQYHKNHGQLGFALMDMEPPNNEEAIKELTEAIRRRPAGEKLEWTDYEGFRAICYTRVGPKENHYKIIADLKATIGGRGTNFSDDTEVKQWLKDNKLKWEDIPSIEIPAGN